MTTAHDQNWYLEGIVNGEQVARRFVLRTFPARIGRAGDADVSIPESLVSSHHAEVYLERGQLWLCDLGSSNGTFVNRTRVEEPVALRAGDVLHVANTELLLELESQPGDDFIKTCVMTSSPIEWITGAHSRARALLQMIELEQVSSVYQPIVGLRGVLPPAFEVLGRGASKELPEAPGALFQAAQEAGLAADLSQCLRRVGLAGARAIPGPPAIYTNVHPAELEGDRLVHELQRLREAAPDLALTVEVHESTVTDPATMRELRACLRELDVRLAYDDFGAGQARLLELSECPPDCLKFDISLVRDLDQAPGPRQRMVQTLVSISREMGVTCLAEGIERAGELETCREMGFDLAQGYFIARPAPAETWQQPLQWPRSDGSAPEEERTVFGSTA